ncbi:unnamed protein product [Meganyctiphanes norvegica]|uniref:C2H2-type domain-containing protein n=1 Tax=Meganyctiphanes norvegica TaxID=48144 RepID=A0AAV2Q4R2_MEGNR
MMDQGVAAPPPAEATNPQDLPLTLFMDDLDEYIQFRNYVSTVPGRMSPPRQPTSHDLYHSQIPITSPYRDPSSYSNLGTSPEKTYFTLQSRTDFSISSLATPTERSCHSLPNRNNTSSVQPPPSEKMYHPMSNQSNNYNTSSNMPDERSYHSLPNRNNNCNNSSPMLNDQSMYHHMYNNRPSNCNSPADNMAAAAAMDQRAYHAMANRPYNSSSPMPTSDDRTYHTLNSRPPSSHMQGGPNNATSVIMSAHNSPAPPDVPSPTMPNGPCNMGGMTPRDNGHMEGHMNRHMEGNPDWQMGHQNYMDRASVNANYNNTTNHHRHSQHNEVPYDNGNFNHNRYEYGEETKAINMSKGSQDPASPVANNIKVKSERLEHVSSTSMPPQHGFATPRPETHKDKMSSSYQLNNPRFEVGEDDPDWNTQYSDDGSNSPGRLAIDEDFLCQSMHADEQGIQPYDHENSYDLKYNQDGGDKPYQCTLCTYKTKYKFYMPHHMRRHTGEKPYVCTYCNTGFTRSTTLKNHMKTGRCMKSRSNH